MDLKIEVTKLYALHNATMKFEHGIREFGKPESVWRDFVPTRFIYAFFTFNSIYSFDWLASFDEGKALLWDRCENNKYPKEEEQIKSYFNFLRRQLGDSSVELFQQKLKEMIALFEVDKPAKELEKIDITNASRELKNLSKQMPGQFSLVYSKKMKPEDFYPASCVLYTFIYRVRCNLFHGRKTKIGLLEENEEQQKRLLIYTALLITADSLLFECASGIGWQQVPIIST